MNLYSAFKQAGGRDPQYLAACAALYANHGINEAVQIFKANRPDLFWPDSLVVNALRPREVRREKRGDGFRGRKRETDDAGSASDDASACETAQRNN